MKIENLKEALQELNDPRRTIRGHILYKLKDIIGLCIIICNGTDFIDMEELGKKRTLA